MLTGLQITRKLVNVSMLLVGFIVITGLLLILTVHLQLLQILLMFSRTPFTHNVPFSSADWIVCLAFKLLNHSLCSLPFGSGMKIV